jgi:hypothetical protein
MSINLFLPTLIDFWFTRLANYSQELFLKILYLSIPKKSLQITTLILSLICFFYLIVSLQKRGYESMLTY